MVVHYFLQCPPWSQGLATAQKRQAILRRIQTLTHNCNHHNLRYSLQVLQPLLPLETLKDSIIACSLGYDKLKKEQEESILNFAKGRDVFVSLPTGYGKSICYIILPWLFDELRKVDKISIVLVVSTLIALNRDQVGSITAMGITATYISDKEATSKKAGN